MSSVKFKSNQKTLTLFDMNVFYNNILVLTVNYLGCEMVLGHYAPQPPPEISQNEATEACEGSN